MFSDVGGRVGLLFCLYALVFHWRVVVAKYGSLSLYWWIVAVTIACWMAGYLLDYAVYGLQLAAWHASR